MACFSLSYLLSLPSLGCKAILHMGTQGLQALWVRKETHQQRAATTDQVAWPISAPLHIRRTSLRLLPTPPGLSLSNRPLKRLRHTAAPSIIEHHPPDGRNHCLWTASASHQS
ncbi:hypothetical protein BJY52DRAFT_683705 [Lactarius psammicola]|nr:hypothetical protein BJY52DRAFT_683705 [Lactarius psammicola]